MKRRELLSEIENGRKDFHGEDLSRKSLHDLDLLDVDFVCANLRGSNIGRII